MKLEIKIAPGLAPEANYSTLTIPPSSITVNIHTFKNSYTTTEYSEILVFTNFYIFYRFHYINHNML